MSGICGIIMLDGSNVDPGLFSRYAESMRFYGPDGYSFHADGSVAMASFLLRTTPEDLHDRQPIVEGKLLFVFAGRLDNRSELARDLSIDAADLSTLPDSHIAFRAWRQYGASVTERLDGDWHCVAWDGSTRTLLLARDHYGISALYYHTTPRFIAFASSKKPLLLHPDISKEIDEIRVAQILVAWFGEGWRTSYAAIRRLPPAHRLMCTDGTTRVERYWNPEHSPLLSYRDRREYEEEFLSLYRDAVRRRLRTIETEVGATLSGGLDSGSVVSLAAPILREEGRRLLAWTSVPLYEPIAPPHRFADEWEMASLTARHAGGNVEHIRVRSEDASILGSIHQQLTIGDEPVHAASNLYWIHDILGRAAGRGIRTILTGQCGNATVSFKGNGQALLALSWGTPLEALRLLFSADRDIVRGVKHQLVDPLLLPLRRLRRRIATNGHPWRGYAAISDRCADRLDLLMLMSRDRHDPTFLPSPFRDLRLRLLMLDRFPAGAVWHEMGSFFGVDVRDPTMDRHLIHFILRVPDHVFVAGGERRLLIRRTMRGIMPDQVLDNRRIGLQGGDILCRVLAEREAIHRTLDQVSRSERSVAFLDIPRMRNILESIEKKDVPTSSSCGTILLRGLSAGLFLMS